MNDDELMLMKLANPNDFQMPLTNKQKPLFASISLNPLVGYIPYVGEPYDHPSEIMPIDFGKPYFKFLYSISGGNIQGEIYGNKVKGRFFYFCYFSTFDEMFECFEHLSTHGIWFRKSIYMRTGRSYTWDIMLNESSISNAYI